jgi:hypothetical protein
MSKYDAEYYFVFRGDDHNDFFLGPDSQTGSRGYGNKFLSNSDGPLIFINQYKDEEKEDGIKKTKSDIMLNGSNVVASDALARHIANKGGLGLQVFPSIFIDDEEIWHEEYSFLNFYERFDCWDRKTSQFYIDEVAELPAEVTKYCLDSKVIESRELNRRLAFKMGGCLDSYVVFHESLVRFIEDNNIGGAKFCSLDVFNEGDQY